MLVASDGTRKIEIVLKVRHPDCRKNHFEQTSLACELICAALAHAVGLPVIPAGWERRPGELDQIFGFLDRRPLRFENISAALRSLTS